MAKIGMGFDWHLRYREGLTGSDLDSRDLGPTILSFSTITTSSMSLLVPIDISILGDHDILLTARIYVSLQCASIINSRILLASWFVSRLNA